MSISLPHKARLMTLAGLSTKELLSEESPYVRSNERIPFNKELMIQAIEFGLEVGILFQSNNKKYKMPMSKYRIIMPVAIGVDSEGRTMLRGVHIVGQSEKEAIRTGQRSAEAKNVWRLFNTANIKSMFFTGKTHAKVPIGGYNPNDSAMVTVMASFNPGLAKKKQADFQRANSEQSPEAMKDKRQGMIKSFFKQDPRQTATTQTDAKAA